MTTTKPQIPGIGRHMMWGRCRVEIQGPPNLSGAFNNHEPVYYVSVFLLDIRSSQWVKCSDLRRIADECESCPLRYDWVKGHHVVDCAGH